MPKIRPELGPDYAGVVATTRGEIAYWEVGGEQRGGGSAVLCLHGFPDHPVGMLPLARALADVGQRCICPALPGYWPSSGVGSGDYSVPAVAADLLEFAEALGLDQPALVGHDWGACVGYFIASRHPERISRLVALATPHPAGFAHRRSIFEEQRTAWYAILLAYSPAGAAMAADRRWLTALIQTWSPGFHWSDWPRVGDFLLQPGVAEAVCGYYRADLEASLDLKPVSSPTTVIFGAQDGCIRPLAYTELDGWFDEPVRCEMLPHVGHWPHLEDPGAVVPLIAAALRGRRPASSGSTPR